MSGAVSLLGGGGVWPANGYLVLKVIKKAMEVEPPLDTQCREKFKIQVMRLSPEERNMDRLDVVSALLSLLSFFFRRERQTPLYQWKIAKEDPSSIDSRIRERELRVRFRTQEGFGFLETASAVSGKGAQFPPTPPVFCRDQS